MALSQNQPEKQVKKGGVGKGACVEGGRKTFEKQRLPIVGVLTKQVGWKPVCC